MSDSEVRRRRIVLRAAEELGEGVVTGLVTTFDDPYPIGRSRKEIITRSTFDLGATIPMFYEHQWGAGPIGHSRALRATDKGIEADFELYIDEDPRARSVWRAMKAGALREFSIGFMADTNDISERRDGDVTTEVINKGELIEVSAVVRGANPNTDAVSVRAVPAAVAPAPLHALPVDPAVAPAGAEPEEPATKAKLLAEAAELVAMADELGMAEQLPNIIKSYIKIFSEGAPAAQPVHDPNAPVAPVAPAPAARSVVDASPEFFAALGRL